MLATLALAYLLIQAGQIILVLFLAILFASALRPWSTRSKRAGYRAA